jgi:ABC-2 type transport system ATP-binding protein
VGRHRLPASRRAAQLDGGCTPAASLAPTEEHRSATPHALRPDPDEPLRDDRKLRFRQIVRPHHVILPSVSPLAIDVVGLTKTFGGNTSALSGVSFSVPVGTVCGLLGHNGAGKTTTINILSTLMRPSSGSATVAGYDIVRQPARVRASIAIAGQFTALDPVLTGRENLVLYGRLRGLRRQQAKARAGELIEEFDLGAVADRGVLTYSGGMRRRVDLATALVVLPRVLFLDEPTVGLDPRGRRSMWALVSSLARQGTTVLLTTQYLEEADVLSDSIVVIDHGQVIASGTAEDLKRRVGASYCQVTPANPADLPSVAAALAGLDGVDIDADMNSVSVFAPDGVATLGEVFRRVDAIGIELADISLRKPSLDEAFLHLTEQPVHQT